MFLQAENALKKSPKECGLDYLTDKVYLLTLKGWAIQLGLIVGLKNGFRKQKLLLK